MSQSGPFSSTPFVAFPTTKATTFELQPLVSVALAPPPVSPHLPMWPPTRTHNALDNRRLEVVADGLTLWRRAQLAIDTKTGKDGKDGAKSSGRVNTPKTQSQCWNCGKTSHQYKDCWTSLGRWPQQQSQGHSHSLEREVIRRANQAKMVERIQRCWSTCVESTAESTLSSNLQKKNSSENTFVQNRFIQNS